MPRRTPLLHIALLHQISLAIHTLCSSYRDLVAGRTCTKGIWMRHSYPVLCNAIARLVPLDGRGVNGSRNPMILPHHKRKFVESILIELLRRLTADDGARVPTPLTPDGIQRPRGRCGCGCGGSALQPQPRAPRHISAPTRSPPLGTNVPCLYRICWFGRRHSTV